MVILPMDCSMRSVLLILIFVSLGCVRPDAPLTRDSAELRQETCSSRQQNAERDRLPSATRRPQHIWLGKVGDALSGAAMALRLPKP